MARSGWSRTRTRPSSASTRSRSPRPSARCRAATARRRRSPRSSTHVMKNAGATQRASAECAQQLIERHCVGCHADFDLKPGMSNTQKDTAALRFMLAQDGWIDPGDPEGGRLHNRVWGNGAEKIMPANGRELIANDPAYKALLWTLDEFVAKAPASADIGIPEPMTVIARWLIGAGDSARPSALRGHGAAAVREPAAHAAGRIHLRHRGAGGRCGGQPLCGEPSAAGNDRQGRGRRGELRAVRRAAGRAASACRSASAATGACLWRTTSSHNIFVFEPGTNTPRVYFHSDSFNQPNDMAIARDGTIYASDPNWKRRDGQVWRIVPGADGNGARRADDAGGASSTPPTASISARTRRRSMSANPRRARSGPIGSMAPSSRAPRLVKKFPDFSIDGMRTDIDGRHLCGAHSERHDRGADAGRQDRARNSR